MIVKLSNIAKLAAALPPGIESDERGPWIQTYTGLRFHFLDPTPDEVSLLDLAHSLSLLCRFTGHTRELYVVGEHCVRVSRVAEKLATDAGFDARGVKRVAIRGLLHEAGEPYTGDMSGPMKTVLRILLALRLGEELSAKIRSDFDRIEAACEAAVFQRFGVELEGARAETDRKLVKQADLILLATEKRDLKEKPPTPWTIVPGAEPLEGHIAPWSARSVRQSFLRRAAKLGIK